MKILIISFLGLSLGYFYVNIQEKVKEKKRVFENRQILPNFQFRDLDSLLYSADEVLLKRATVLIYFNSECNYCQYEAQEIFKHADQLQNSQVLMVSSESLEQIRSFEQAYRLNEMKNVKVLHSSPEHFYESFGLLGVPNILIYDENKRLKKHFQGETKFEAIMKYL